MKFLGFGRAITVLLVLCVGLLGAVLYHTIEIESAASDGPSPTAIGKFTPLAAPRPAPEVGFQTRSGETAHLADFRGHLVLVNLWATWCGPCIKEMPSLDRLQAKLGGDLTILAISQDRRGADVVDPFLEKLGLGSLAIYLDPKNAVGHAFAVQGLPTSVLIDADGNIEGQVLGEAEWDSPAMVKMLHAYVRPPLQKASATR
jgi:thiol-disulfide isomerase/thioredoxin